MVEEKKPAQSSSNNEAGKEIPEKFKTLVESIEKLSVLELSELVKALEERFGVSVSAIAAVSAAPAHGETPAGVAEEKSTFAIELKNAGGQKIQVIKVLRDALGLGLKEAKDMTDAAPKVVKEGVAKAEADELKKKLEEAGATVELK